MLPSIDELDAGWAGFYDGMDDAETPLENTQLDSAGFVPTLLCRLGLPY